MLLFSIYIQYVAFAVPVEGFLNNDDSLMNAETFNESIYDKFNGLYSFFSRKPRAPSNKDIHPIDQISARGPTCDQMKLTQNSPFIVLILFKSSGRFLGMGSILDQQTVLTSYSVVRTALDKPENMLVLAGRLNPWWGDGSQVYPAKQIAVHINRIAVVRLDEPFIFNRFTHPIKLIKREPKDYVKEFTREWGIFGIPRGSWNLPGDEAERTSVYLMKIETMVEPNNVEDCKSNFPDIEYNDTYHACTIANYSFGWGSEGSPTIAVDRKDKVLQIAVITDAARKRDDNYHLHVKLGKLSRWIRAHSLVGFVDDSEEREELFLE